MNIAGNLVHANDNGVFTIFDKDYLEEEYKLALEQDEYTRKILSFCLASDEISSKLLTDGDVARLKTLLGKGSLAALQNFVTAQGYDIAISDELNDVSGMPSYIQALEGNIKSLAISKLKILVRAVNPSVENALEGYDSGKEDGPDVKE